MLPDSCQSGNGVKTNQICHAGTPKPRLVLKQEFMHPFRAHKELSMDREERKHPESGPDPLLRFGWYLATMMSLTVSYSDSTFQKLMPQLFSCRRRSSTEASIFSSTSHTSRKPVVSRVIKVSSGCAAVRTEATASGSSLMFVSRPSDCVPICTIRSRCASFAACPRMLLTAQISRGSDANPRDLCACFVLRLNELHRRWC